MEKGERRWEIRGKISVLKIMSGTFWAVKTDMFGKEKPPYIFERKEFDQLSDKEKAKYRILE